MTLYTMRQLKQENETFISGRRGGRGDVPSQVSGVQIPAYNYFLFCISIKISIRISIWISIKISISIIKPHLLRLELEAKSNQESGYNAGFKCHHHHHYLQFFIFSAIPSLFAILGEIEPFLSSDTDDTDSDPEIQEVVKTINIGHNTDKNEDCAESALFHCRSSCNVSPFYIPIITFWSKWSGAFYDAVN